MDTQLEIAGAGRSYRVEPEQGAISPAPSLLTFPTSCPPGNHSNASAGSQSLDAFSLLHPRELKKRPLLPVRAKRVARQIAVSLPQSIARILRYAHRHFLTSVDGWPLFERAVLFGVWAEIDMGLQDSQFHGLLCVIQKREPDDLIGCL
ncbi:hypothetical protein D3C85_1517460 [compost metagenome]